MRIKKIVLVVIVCLGISSVLVIKNLNNNKELSSNVTVISDNEEVKKDEKIVEKTDDEEAEVEALKNIINNEFFILVNKENLLSQDFMPDNLIYSDIEFLSYIETRHLNEEVAYYAKAMFDDALQEGIELLGASGFRSYEIQQNLFYSRADEIGVEAASIYTAPPGASEHQTGLALDIVGSDYQTLDDGFDQSESFQWLVNNCYKYGFILRYLDGKENITGFGYEPWHFRYVGNSEIAEEIMKRNITLEEYLNEVNNKIEEISQ